VTTPSKGRALVDRGRMVALAREYNIFVSYSTVYRWTCEPGFPTAVGKSGKSLLYDRIDFVNFIERLVSKIESDG